MVNPKEITGLSITAVSTSQSNLNKVVPDPGSSERKRQAVATVYLPRALFDKVNKSEPQRVTVFVFDDEKLFLTQTNMDNSISSKRNTSKTVGSKILAVSIKGSELRNLSDDQQVRTTFSTTVPSTKAVADCVFWDFSGAGMFIFHKAGLAQIYLYFSWFSNIAVNEKNIHTLLQDYPLRNLVNTFI